MVCKAVLVDALVFIAHAPASSGHAPGTSHRGPALEAVLRVLGPVQRDPLSASKAGASALMPCKTFTEVCPKGRGPNSPWKNCRILGPFPTEISNRQNSRLALIWAHVPRKHHSVSVWTRRLAVLATEHNRCLPSDVRHGGSRVGIHSRAKRVGIRRPAVQGDTGNEAAERGVVCSEHTSCCGSGPDLGNAAK